MSATQPRGNALTFVLILIAVIMTIIFAATMLQPVSARALDDHYQRQSLQACADAALDDALARLQSGKAAEFESDRVDGSNSLHARVQQLGAPSDDHELLITVRETPSPHPPSDAAALERKMTVNATVTKGAGVWRVQKYVVLEN